MNEPEELQTSDGSEHGPFPRRTNLFWNHDDRSPVHLIF